jgi:hypothetical protein
MASSLQVHVCLVNLIVCVYCMLINPETKKKQSKTLVYKKNKIEMETVKHKRILDRVFFFLTEEYWIIELKSVITLFMINIKFIDKFKL